MSDESELAPTRMLPPLPADAGPGAPYSTPNGMASTPFHRTNRVCAGRAGPSDGSVPADCTPGGYPTLPAVGSHFLGFRLIAVLGRGAFGQVYLAEQDDLAHRFVTVKIAKDIFGESQMLAQLQHTHIVPIYSIHRTDAFQVVCMPY